MADEASRRVVSIVLVGTGGLLLLAGLALFSAGSSFVGAALLAAGVLDLLGALLVSRMLGRGRL